MRPVHTLVLIANEQEARLLCNRGPGRGLVEVAHFDKLGQVRYADTPGRGQATPGGARHGFDRSSSEREQGRNSFADDVLKVASAEWEKGGYDRFALSAPPQMLGALRAGIGGKLQEALIADLNKDLLGVAVADLPRHFEDVIVF